MHRTSSIFMQLSTLLRDYFRCSNRRLLEETTGGRICTPKIKCSPHKEYANNALQLDTEWPRLLHMYLREVLFSNRYAYSKLNCTRIIVYLNAYILCTIHSPTTFYRSRIFSMNYYSTRSQVRLPPSHHWAYVVSADYRSCISKIWRTAIWNFWPIDLLCLTSTRGIAAFRK